MVRDLAFPVSPQTHEDLHSGGYRKEYLKGSKSVGMALEDTWLLQLVAYKMPKRSQLSSVFQHGP